MKYEIYNGHFASRAGVTWEVKIFREQEHSPEEVEELSFPASEPLVIEWSETSKEDAIVSSIAHLQILSPSDRKYIGLWSIAPGQIRLDVFREGDLYWSGTLDPEFYEEPYSTMDGYIVELTFSDFGILERLKYNLSGVQNCRDLIETILNRSGIQYNAIDDSAMTTGVDIDINKPVPSPWSGLRQLLVRSDNWYDEDGEASSLQDVVTGILQPLGLRMEQRSGTVWIYDLHGAYTTFGLRSVRWQSDDQMLGVDKIVNNAKITLSTYSSSKLLEEGLNYPGTYSDTDAPQMMAETGKSHYSYYEDMERMSETGNVDRFNISFSIYYTNPTPAPQNTGLAYKMSSAFYFHILPLLGADEADGIAYMFYSGGHGNLSTTWPKLIGKKVHPQIGVPLMKTLRVFLPSIAQTERSKYYLRLVQEILCDVRYNPFVDVGGPNNQDNEQSNYNNMNAWFGYVMIAASVNLYDENGVAVWHYTNESVARSTDKMGSIIITQGEWRQGADPSHSTYLEWYDPDDRKESCGVGGWKANRHCIGLSTKELYKTFKKMDDGQYMPYPPEGGYLEITIYEGLRIYDYGATDFNNIDENNAARKGLYDKLRWLLYKTPSLDVVRSNITRSDEELEDIEYNSCLNPDAKEDLEIQTTCGTSQTSCPTSKALFLSAQTKLQLKTMRRAGRNTQVEELLLGTLYSQFADRKTKLSGTMEIHSFGPKLYTEASLPSEMRLLMLADYQDVQADTSEAVLVELRPDEYEKSN